MNGGQWRILAAIAMFAALAGAFSMWALRADTGSDTPPVTVAPARVTASPPPPPRSPMPTATPTPSDSDEPLAEVPEVVEPDPDQIFEGDRLEDLATVAMARAHRTKACYLEYAKEYGDIDPLPMLVLEATADGRASVRLGSPVDGRDSIESCLNEAFADAKFNPSEGDPRPMRWRMPELENRGSAGH